MKCLFCGRSCLFKVGSQDGLVCFRWAGVETSEPLLCCLSRGGFKSLMALRIWREWWMKLDSLFMTSFSILPCIFTSHLLWLNPYLLLCHRSKAWVCNAARSRESKLWSSPVVAKSVARVVARCHAQASHRRVGFSVPLPEGRLEQSKVRLEQQQARQVSGRGWRRPPGSPVRHTRGRASVKAWLHVEDVVDVPLWSPSRLARLESSVSRPWHSNNLPCSIFISSFIFFFNFKLYHR